MTTYTIFDKPLKVSGVPFFEKNKRLARLPDELISLLPHLDHLGRRCAGFQNKFSLIYNKGSLKDLSGRYRDVHIRLSICTGYVG